MPGAGRLAHRAHAPGSGYPRPPGGGLRAGRRRASARNPGRAGCRRACPRRHRPGTPAQRAGQRRRLHRRLPRAQAAGRSWFRAGADGASRRRLLRWLADAPQPGPGADVPVRTAAARRADQPPRSRCDPLAGRVAEELPRHAVADLPRPRFSRLRGRQHRASGSAQADALSRRLFGLRTHPCRAPGAAAAGLREAAGAARAHGEIHRPLQGPGDQGTPGAEPHQGAGAFGRAGACACGFAVRLQLPRGRQDIQPAARHVRGASRLWRQDRAGEGQAATGTRRADRPARPQRRRQVDPDQDAVRRPVPALRASGARREPRHRLLRPAPARFAGCQGQPAAASAAHRPG
ncbi:hypothetical protein D9M71_440170 [compost metagenome]